MVSVATPFSRSDFAASCTVSAAVCVAVSVSKPMPMWGGETDCSDAGGVCCPSLLLPLPPSSALLSAQERLILDRKASHHHALPVMGVVIGAFGHRI